MTLKPFRECLDRFKKKNTYFACIKASLFKNKKKIFQNQKVEKIKGFLLAVTTENDGRRSYMQRTLQLKTIYLKH